MTLEKELADLASYIAKKAREDDAGLQEATDALKALTTYYGMLKKHRSDDGGAGESSFADLVRDAEEHADGAASAVRGHRGRRPTAQ